MIAISRSCQANWVLARRRRKTASVSLGDRRWTFLRGIIRLCRDWNRSIADKSSATLAAIPQRRYVGLGIKDPLEQRCQCLEGPPLLVGIFVSVVGAADARHNVAQAPLGVVGRHASTRHQAARSPAQIVQSPAGDAAGFVEFGLKYRKAVDRMLAVVGEDKFPSQPWRLIQNDFGCCRKRDHKLHSRLVPLPRH